jgi:phosphate transport system substrate-binding protein
MHCWLRRDVVRLLTLALACDLAAAACRQPPARDAGGGGPAAGAASGVVTVDGSSTVLPISRSLGATFERANPRARIAISESGTGGGSQKLCRGAVDMVGASRPLDAAELAQCESNRITFVELPIAFDSLSVVVNPKNTSVDCLTVAELKRIWEPAAEQTITRWNQIRASFPAQPLTLVGPGPASGTFDYFTLAIVGAAGQSRKDYRPNEDDQKLVDAIAADPNALGYFGFAYYLANIEKVKTVAVDSGLGCVKPSLETVADASYQPLSRPLFVYVTTTALTRPEVKAFARTYVNPANAARIRELGYLPLPTAALLLINRRLESGITGSVFAGRGSVVGLTADVLEDAERVQNALVR